MKDRVVWQPGGIYQQDREFNITLESRFARKMLKIKIGAQKQGEINNLAQIILEERGFHCKEACIFHEDTALVQKFRLGMGSACLSLGENGRLPKSQIFKYNSDGIDFPLKAYVLMALVDLWVTYSDNLIEKYK
ncbi:hypothetical protein HY212_01190 [Candidatus Pacearchaeota archaeon]|nr:hypothetical protein [Candidatus Pacearchaeota archaeon]